ncbi:hypothetical protein [Hymenobacter glacieicola]|uniref:Uncharacterized protein n=1 Tax=Hymenobacter glacieicola TaxID=1562124 RepID=A0ABQ1WLN2_9BACT|nr:hypothetical protein [Hymenobacter glacieicola]GGG34008.1 hypothetical protein GCM10011378_08040 [Hymenobacter glacieicola]
MKYRPDINARAYSRPLLEARLDELEKAERHATTVCRPRIMELRAIRKELSRRNKTLKSTI